ncbi:MAG: helix-turn-helix transcriptional regulator [Candidatus Dormibacteria bacterium]|jgi:transcriptional regulator with XRE-family HTH domain
MQGPAPSVPFLAQMAFPDRLVALRRLKGLTQQSLSDSTGIHVTQIRRYEAGKAEPTLEILRKLARGLGVTGDALLFDETERGPQQETFRMRLEAIDRLDPAEVKTLEEVVDGLLLKHEARRWVRSA